MSGLIFYPGILRPVVAPINDGINPVSTTAATRWNIGQRVSSTVAVKWKIIAYGISASAEVEYNVRARIEKVGAFTFYGITKPVVWPVDYHEFIPQVSWDIYDRTSSVKKSEWRVNQRRSSGKLSEWHVLYSDYATEAIEYRALKRIYKPGVTLGYWINQLDLPVVHPLTYDNYSINPSVQWHLDQRLFLDRDIRWNTRVPVLVQKVVSWNTKALSVTKQLAVEWDLRQEISKQLLSDWHMNQRRFSRKPITWSTNYSLVIHKQIKWNALNPVVARKQTTWNIQQFISKKSMSRWKTLSPVKARSVSVQWDALFRTNLINWQLVFNSPGNISTGIVRPIDISTPALQPRANKGLSQPVFNPIDNATYSSYGQTPYPGIAWRVPVDPVTKQQAIKWNDLYRVPAKTATTWNLSERKILQQRSLYNIYYKVTDSLASTWVIGAWVPSHIRQTAQRRVDFAY